MNVQRVKSAELMRFKDVPRGDYFFDSKCGLMRKMVVPILKGIFLMEAMHFGSGPSFMPCCIADESLVIRVEGNLNETI